MITYFDTSAVVPMLVRESSTVTCQEIWNASDDVVTSRLTYVETAAALAQALRNGKLSVAQHHASLELLEAVWAQCDVLDLDQPLAVAAAALAHEHGLRGYDAVHCASAAQLQDDDLVAASDDRQLLRAWATLGITTCDVSSDSLGEVVR